MGRHSDKFIKLLAETDNEELCNAFLDYQKEKKEEIHKAIEEIKPAITIDNKHYAPKNDIDE